jgi:hypothetical protein
MGAVIRIAMWSGPRNISTALMRAFGARADTAVIDEPFYAAYLAATGLEHPMRADVLASQPHDASRVIAGLLGDVPLGRRVFYQKHMTQHMLPDFDRSWLSAVTNAFLLREPRAVLASYAQKRGDVQLSDIGVTQQRELFEREADRLGHAPPVIESADVLADPAGVLSALCVALGIEYAEAMLHWQAGRHASDGVWAPAWYSAVEQSTGFAAPQPRTEVRLPDALARIAEQAQPHYDLLAAHRLMRA